MDEPSFLDFLNAFGAIATPVLMLVLTAIGWNVRTRLQRRHDLEDKLREDRISIYNGILEPFIIMLTSDAAWRSDPANKNKDKYAIATTKMLSFQYRKTGFRMSLIGSDAVIRAYNELMQYFFQRQGQSAPPAEAEVKNMMSMLGTLLLEIRRSMGNEATKVDNWEMLEWFLTDARKYRKT